MFTSFNLMDWIFSDAQLCAGLVLNLLHLAAVTLPLPSPEVLGQGIKTELLHYVNILTTNLIPALAFALIVRKLTS
jgi:hypothetical protein